MALLEVEDLQVHFRTADGIVRAVDGVSFQVHAGQTLAVVGESGCGKSVMANSILRLLPEPPARIAGAIRFDGRDLLKLRKRDMRRISGRRDQHDLPGADDEPQPGPHHRPADWRDHALHDDLSTQKIRDRTIEMLRLVGIPEPHRRLGEYPHQLSGGMQQRVMIAIALSCNPKR